MRALLVALSLMLFLLPAPLWAATVEGRIVLGEEPVAGAAVAAYSSLDFSAEPVALSGPSGADGSFSMELPEGRYAFFMHEEKRGLFAFCGRNPVSVGSGDNWVGMQAVAASAVQTAPYDSDYSGAVEGRVVADGKSLAGAHVYLYLDAADDLKGQGYRLSPPTGSDGFFAFDDLPESRYFLVARQRQSGARVGPVLEGDYLGIHAGNPIAVRAGVAARVELPAVRKVKSAGNAETLGRGGAISVSGRVTDRQGRSVSGVHVFAYVDRVIGHQRPAALSPPTGENGRFRVSFAQAGTYYIGARQHYGDSPAPGELFGMYDESADHGLNLEAGLQLEGLTIVVEPVRFD